MEIAQDKSGDALYRTGYLCIDLPFEVKQNIEDYNTRELGTFVHEYVHFLQNLTTPWGLYEAARLYERISYFINQLKNDDYPIIYVPVEEEYLTTHEKVVRVLHYGRGADKDSLKRDVYQLRFSEDTQFQYSILSHDFGEYTVPQIVLSFNTIAHGRAEISFGAWTIKESMAALIQEKIDFTSPNRHADVPYNVVKHLAKDCFPNIAEDKDKLIAICYASLFSLSPAKEFMNLATTANNDSYKKWEEILQDYFNGKINFNNQSYSFEDFYHLLSTKFIHIARKILLADKLAYIEEIINATQLGNNSIPLLCFTGNARTADDMKKIMSAVGHPAIIGTGDKGIFPSLDNDTDSQTGNVLLLGYETLYKFLTSKKMYCPRMEQCMDANKVGPSCNLTPWDRDDDCPMTEVAKLLGIQDKHVIRK